MGVLSVIYCVVVLIMPFVIEFLAPNNAAGEWAWFVCTTKNPLLNSVKKNTAGKFVFGPGEFGNFFKTVELSQSLKTA